VHRVYFLLAETRAGWRAGANHGEISPEDRSLFYLKTSAPRRLLAAGPVRRPIPHSGGPGPTGKHNYIDAFNGKTVTRETLLRYTFKSLPVNVLIRGFLCKTSPPGLSSLPPIGRKSFGMASLVSHAVAALGLGACFYGPGIVKRVCIWGAACSVIPDLDVIGFRFGLHYGDFRGHRGSHLHWYSPPSLLAL
jgi:hypothetical protein